VRAGQTHTAANFFTAASCGMVGFITARLLLLTIAELFEEYMWGLYACKPWSTELQQDYMDCRAKVSQSKKASCKPDGQGCTHSSNLCNDNSNSFLLTFPHRPVDFSKLSL
jgi:hypothetical protein